MTRLSFHLNLAEILEVMLLSAYVLAGNQRILGKVLLSGQGINLEQITSGMAWYYKKYQAEIITLPFPIIQPLSHSRSGQGVGYGVIIDRVAPEGV